MAALARADEEHALGLVGPTGVAQGGFSSRGALGGGPQQPAPDWLNTVLAANWSGWLAAWLSGLVRAARLRDPPSRALL